jgi:hypothetical protein
VKKSNMVMARFENPFDGKLRKIGDAFLTTKGTGHTGSGLSIVRAAAESYGGKAVLKSGGGTFSAMILLPMQATETDGTDGTAEELLSAFPPESSAEDMGVLFVNAGHYLSSD